MACCVFIVGEGGSKDEGQGDGVKKSKVLVVHAEKKL